MIDQHREPISVGSVRASGGVNRPDATDIAARLAERMEPLAIGLVGELPKSRSRTELRFYPKGGLAVTIAGPKRGVWCSHGEGGIGGDALDMVKHFRHCSTAEALDWSRRWLGIDDGVAHRPAP